jgi:hypothetical protein
VKNIEVGTLLAFFFFSFSDGVLCFLRIFCVFFLRGPSASKRVRIWTYRFFSHDIILPDDAASSVV